MQTQQMSQMKRERFIVLDGHLQQQLYGCIFYQIWDIGYNLSSNQDFFIKAKYILEDWKYNTESTIQRKETEN